MTGSYSVFNQLYMKKLLFLFALLFSLVACRAQLSPTVAGSQPVIPTQPYEFSKWISIGPYTTAKMPTPAACPRCLLYNSDSNNYAFSTGSAWHYWGAGGGGGGSFVPVWGTITGTITTQLDLMNLFALKVNYTDTSAMLSAYLRATAGVKYADTANMLIAYLRVALGMKYTDTAGMLSAYLRAALFTKAGIGLGNVANSLQVINAGGMASMQAGTFASIPAVGSGPTMWWATDTLAWYYNNGSAYQKMQGGSGGGGGGGDDSTYMLSKHQATLLYVPLSAYTNHGIDSLIGFTPYNSTNPNGFISANQTITLSNGTGSDVSFSTTGATVLQPTVTINTNAVTYAKMQQILAKTILGNQSSSTGNIGGVYIGSGIVWNVDTLKSDTTLLATQSWALRQGFLTGYTETDPVANAKVITLNGTSGRGIAIAGTAGQALSGSPIWTFTIDTAYAATIGYVNRQGFLKTETDPVAIAKTITFTQGRGALVSNVTAQTIGSNPTVTIGADTTIMASKYYVGSQGFLTSYTETDPIANAKVITLNGTANRGIVVTGTAGQALSGSPVWALTIDTNYAATKNYANTTFLPLTGHYHILFKSQNTTAASAGDTSYVSGHDSTITLAGIIDSLNFHHTTVGGRLVMWATGGGGGGITADTLSLFQSITATGDTLKGYNSSQPKFLGAQVFIPSYVAKVSSGLMSAAKGARLDSTVTVEWGHGGHHIFRAPWTKDSLMGKDINLVDTSGTLAITLLGPPQNRDSTYGLTFNISAANLATASSVTTALALKANIASPTFTGVPAAPTATVGTNTTQLATTAFVQAAVSGGGSGVTTVNTFSSVSQTNGAAIAGVNITFGPADTTNPGMVTPSAQTIKGVKNFISGITVNGVTSTTGAITCVGCSSEWWNNPTPTDAFAAGLQIPGGSTGSDWYLSSYNGTAWSGVMHAYQSGQIQHMKYGTHSFSGTLAYGLGEDASGNMIELTKGIDFAPGTSALVTGIVKSTTSTGALSIAVASDFPILNQSTSGTAGNLSGMPNLPNGTTATTQTVGDNTTKLATTAYVGNVAASYAPLASPTFSGTPSVPTAAPGTSTTQAASTAFVATSFAPLASPAFSGVPTGPTAANSTNTTQLATTAFVQNTVAGLAPLASPNLTGTPIAPTATNGTNTTQIATTAFVQSAVAPLSTVLGGGEWTSQVGTGVTLATTTSVNGVFELIAYVTVNSISATTLNINAIYTDTHGQHTIAMVPQGMTTGNIILPGIYMMSAYIYAVSGTELEISSYSNNSVFTANYDLSATLIHIR